MAQKKEYIARENEIGGGLFDIRFVSQKRRDEIVDAHTRRGGGPLAGDLDINGFQNEMADELIAGWHRVTPQVAMRLGYEDFEDLPVNDDGEVPYTVPTARKLYRGCLRDRFAQPIDQISRNILDALAREKKPVSESSATLSGPSV